MVLVAWSRKNVAGRRTEAPARDLDPNSSSDVDEDEVVTAVSKETMSPHYSTSGHGT